jgi:Uma2 family endonuclease
MATAGVTDRDQAVTPPDPDRVPKGFEIINDELVEKPAMGFESSWVVTRLTVILDHYCSERANGVTVSGEAGYRCFPGKPRQVRKPDVSVILCDPATFVPPRKTYRSAPDLVVEVVSPNDTVYDLDTKVQEFLTAGTKLVWVVNPQLRTVLIHRPDGSLQLLTDPAELTGENVLPGFATPLAAFLPRRPAAQPQ